MNKRSFFFLFIGFLFPIVAGAAYGDTTTYVSRLYFGDGKDRLEAYFDFPEDLAISSNGTFYIADTFNHVIRTIAPNGTVDTLAGTGSFGNVTGSAAKAEFAYPRGVALDANGNVYVADSENNSIKKISGGSVSTLVTGLNKPEGVLVYGNTLYFLDTGNNALKRVPTSGGTVTTVSGSLSDPKKLAISSDGRYVYVANAGTHQVKRVDTVTTAITTTAGTGAEGDDNGSCTEATFENLYGVYLYDDDTLYVSDGDGFNDYVRKIDLTSGCSVSVFASDVNMVSINFPRGLSVYDGELYAVATGIGIIQRYNIADPNDNERYAGANRFNVKRSKPVLTGNPKFLVLSKNKKTIFFSENNRIRKMRRGSRKAPLVAGSVIDNYNKNDNKGYVGNEARFSDVPSFALSRNGKKLFVVDRNNNRIKEVVIKTKTMRYLTGAGIVNARGSQDNGFANGGACPNEQSKEVKGCAYFNRPTGSVLSPDGKKLYVADSGNNVIRRVIVRGPNKGKVTTLAGNGSAGFKDATGTDAQFNAPIGLALSAKGGVLYVADRNNHRIRKINVETGVVTTLAGTGTNGYADALFGQAVFSYPEWITRGMDGKLYVSEVGSNRIRVLDRSLGVTKLVSGSGNRGFTNGPRTKTRFNNPKGLLGLKKKLLVAELYNDQVRSIDIQGTAPYTDAAPTVSSVVPEKVAKEWFSGNSASVQVRGTGFRYGAKAFIGSHEANATYVNSSSQVVIDMPIADMAAGYYTIRIQNSDGQYDDLYRGLAVSANGTVPVVDYTP